MTVRGDLHKDRDSGLAWAVMIDVSVAPAIQSILIYWFKRRRWSGFLTACHAFGFRGADANQLQNTSALDETHRLTEGTDYFINRTADHHTEPKSTHYNRNHKTDS